MDRELLIEIGVEELPASWLPGLTRQLGERLGARLTGHRIAPGAPVETYATPRRLTARLAKIAERQEDLEEVVTGPPVASAFDAGGQPTPAAVGFARKHGVTVADLGRAETARGTYLSYLKRQRGKSAIDALPDVLGDVLRDLAFPKQMKWDATLDDGRGEFVFGRPIRWLLFLYGGRVVPFTIGRAPNAAGPQVQDVESGALTYGHRFLATSGRPGRSIKVRSFDEYLARLKEHFVVLDHDERRDRIARDLEGHARRLNGRVALKEHHGLIDEVADLVEYPAVVAGFFDPAFLGLPEEVLTTTLVHHQHYFPVVSDRGDVKEAFLAVVNIQPKDERLIAKNAERVVTGRLRDARFFWESDRKSTLESRLDRLHTVQFHKQLGSYRDKAQRIEALAKWIAVEAFGKPEAGESAGTAARLAKADLTTDMVFEFPELQGRMGGIYAREEGQPDQVWKAIYHHYLPIAVEADAPPTREQLGAAAVTWAAVSLADKLDTVAGLFASGERPTGSGDPFGIRRNAQGAIRILMDLPELTGINVEMRLGDILDRARADFEHLATNVGAEMRAYGFWGDRIRFALEQRGIRTGEARAVINAGPRLRVRGEEGMLPAEHVYDIRPLRARRIAEALRHIRGSEDLQALAVLFKRVKNIARELAEVPPLDRGALTEDAELALLAELDARRPVVDTAASAADYARALTEIAAFRTVVDRFFTEVFVMAEDARVRTARLTLMASLRDLILDLADISEIVPHTE
jgi:glycyl-tRNA synthetase beta chain